MQSGFQIRRLDHDSPAPMRGGPRGPSFVRRLLRRFVGTVSSAYQVVHRRFGGVAASGVHRDWRRLLRSGILICTGLGILYFLFLWFTLPDVEDPRSLIASQSTVILDRNGTELYRLFSEEDRTFITGDKIPEHMKQAVVAIEDERFYDRGCLDIRALLRAAVTFGRGGGASTITRQLARNALNLYEDSVVTRKFKELLLGCQLERIHSKEELLELYLNWIPFGRNAYGIEQASSVYFSAPAEKLTLAQSAVLAALPQRPSYFSPYGAHVRTTVDEEVVEEIIDGSITKASQISDDSITIGLLGAKVGTGSTTIYLGGRTDQVLRNMQDQGAITEQERLTALLELETLKFQPARENIRAPHFVLWVREQVEQLLGAGATSDVLEQGGLIIETTLDWELQQAAEDVINFHKEDIAARYGALNVSLVSIDPQTKEVLAYVGNMDYNDEAHGGKIDMVRAPRQPGSSFKPFVYAAAFQQGYSPATVLYDVPTVIGEDEPQNFDGKFWGLITIRQALGGSRNIPAAKAFFLAGGEGPILALAEKLGVPTPLRRKMELRQERGGEFDYGWPLALGAAETPLIEMVHGYSTFASGGVDRPIVSIRKITDKAGNLLYEAPAPETEQEQVLDPRIAYEITSILSDVSVRPIPYWQTQLSVPGFETAAKTGTSNKCLEREKDGSCRLRKPDNGWVIGYTPELVTGVWIGNADSSSLYDRGDGLNTASPYWHDYMLRAHRLIPVTKTTFDVPEGIVQPQISMLSGQLPTACTPVHLRRADVFLAENAPTLPDPACAQLTVDKVTGLLASPACPTDALASGSFLVARSILAERWPQWEEGVQKWVTEQMNQWNATPDHSGAIIPLPVAPTKECDPRLTPGRLVKPEVSILFPAEGGVANHPSFKPQIDMKVGSSIREVSFVLDGKKQQARTDDFERPLRVPQTISKDGIHTLEVIVVDEYYNVATDTVRFRFEEDTSQPTIRLTAPPDGTAVERGSEIMIHAEATDPDGGIKFVEFFLDETLLTTKPKEPFELRYPLDAEPGTHVIRAVAEDFAKNRTEDEVTITVVRAG